MRLSTPKVLGPYGLEPALRYDFLSPDELAGQGATLFPSANPPLVSQGMTLNGATQYASVRSAILIPQQFSLYIEFSPAFAYTANIVPMFFAGATVSAGWFFKNDNANLNRLFYLFSGGSFYVNGAAYGALWRNGARNRIAIRAVSGAAVMYLNGSALFTNNAPWVVAQSPYYYIGNDPGLTTPFPGTFYNVSLYTRLLTAAEAVALTTGSP